MFKKFGRLGAGIRAAKSLPYAAKRQTELARDHKKLLDAQNALLMKQNALLAAQNDVLRKVHAEAVKTRLATEALRWAHVGPVLDVAEDFLGSRQLDMLDSLALIKKERLNLARFGDGEVRQMLRADYNITFQRNSPALMRALADVVRTAENQPDKVLMALPSPSRNTFWGGFYAELWPRLQPLLSGVERFARANVSRPYVFEVYGAEAVDAWRSLWDALDVTVVAGKGSRFTLLPELFDNVASIRFEYSLPTNAFSDVPRLLDRLTEDPSDLVLLALGPAGTVLAGELALRGTWALDIGHLSASYEKVFKEGAAPEDLPLVVTEPDPHAESRAESATRAASKPATVAVPAQPGLTAATT